MSTSPLGSERPRRPPQADPPGPAASSPSCASRRQRSRRSSPGRGGRRPQEPRKTTVGSTNRARRRPCAAASPSTLPGRQPESGAHRRRGADASPGGTKFRPPAETTRELVGRAGRAVPDPRANRGSQAGRPSQGAARDLPAMPGAAPETSSEKRAVRAPSSEGGSAVVPAWAMNRGAAHRVVRSELPPAGRGAEEVRTRAPRGARAMPSWDPPCPEAQTARVAEVVRVVRMARMARAVPVAPTADAAVGRTRRDRAGSEERAAPPHPRPAPRSTEAPAGATATPPGLTAQTARPAQARMAHAGRLRTTRVVEFRRPQARGRRPRGARLRPLEPPARACAALRGRCFRGKGVAPPRPIPAPPPTDVARWPRARRARPQKIRCPAPRPGVAIGQECPQVVRGMRLPCPRLPNPAPGQTICPCSA
jgi:hypothetical protein